MNNPYSCVSLLNMSISHIIIHGAMGSLTMGIYHGYITSLMFECIKDKNELK